MYQPSSHVLWDAWFLEVDGTYPAYYLQAPKGLTDPEALSQLADVLPHEDFVVVPRELLTRFAPKDPRTKE